MTSTGIDMQDLRAGRSIPPGAASAMYPPLPAYAVPNDDQRESNNATSVALAMEPPPSTIPDYTPLENGSASAIEEDAASLHPPAISCSRRNDPDLPLYQNVSERLPAYTSRPSPSPSSFGFGVHDSPRTLPMILFKTGFLFPPMWILGASFIVTKRPSKWYPYRHPWLEEQQRTEAEKEAYMAHVRVVEVMWARRCLIALGMVLCFGLAAGVTGFAIMDAESKMS